MKILLDVGAHVGETLAAAIESRYGFDRIYCFEPAQECRAALSSFHDPRVEILPFGLWKQTTEMPIYDSGAMGGSIFAHDDSEQPTETISLRRATEWFADNLRHEDTIHLKLNCEGAECDILEDLIGSGEIDKVDSVMVDFDVRKFGSQAHREAQVMDQIRQHGGKPAMWLKEEVKGPSHTFTIYNWLNKAGAVEDRSVRPLWWIRFGILPPVTRFLIRMTKGAARRLLPRAVYRRLQIGVYRKVYAYPIDERPPPS